MSVKCHCGSGSPFATCCKAIISGACRAETPQALMRSRYSAYCEGDFSYIWRTYGQTQRKQLTIERLGQDAHDTLWIGLRIHSTPLLADHQVEFSAWYFYKRELFQLHETSDFEIEQGEWRYTHGVVHTDSGRSAIGRNEKCVCSSGRKYKQCCMKLFG